MKLIATDAGRVISQFPAEEMRPLGGLHTPDMIQKISERYSFASAPDLSLPLEKLNQEGFKFRFGKLIIDSGQVEINELSAFGDGLVISAQRTDDGEAFLNDLMAWLTESFGMRELQRPPTKWFYSQVVVEFNGEMNQLLRAFDNISSSLGRFLIQAYNIKEPVQLSRVTLNCDRLKLLSSTLSTDFTIERRINRPYEEERFLCAAPLKTEDHVRALKMLEKAAASN